MQMKSTRRALLQGSALAVPGAILAGTIAAPAADLPSDTPFAAIMRELTEARAMRERASTEASALWDAIDARCPIPRRERGSAEEMSEAEFEEWLRHRDARSAAIKADPDYARHQQLEADFTDWNHEAWLLEIEAMSTRPANAAEARQLVEIAVEHFDGVLDDYHGPAVKAALESLAEVAWRAPA